MQRFPFFFRPLPHICFWAVLATITSIVIIRFDLDPLVSELAYNPNKDWIDKSHFAVNMIYRFGPLISFLLFLFCLIGFLNLRFVTFKENLFSVIFPAFFSLLVGPILIVNGLLKKVFNRPRPNNIEIFDSHQPFARLFEIGEGGESFSSGHAAAGFSLTILFFGIYYIGHKKIAYMTYVSGMLAGIVLGIVRILQGGHFLSDVLWSLFVTQMVNVAIFALYVHFKPGFVFLRTPADDNAYLKMFVLFISIAVFILFIVGFAYRLTY